MILGIIASLAAIAGIVWGALRRSTGIVVTSAVVLVFVLAVWAYFWFNPY